jgi:hypothetical protein
MRYRLRTLMILLALGPPILAGVWWAWPKVVESPKKPGLDDLIALIVATNHPDSWDDIGGPGAIDSFRPICSIIVVPQEEPFGPDACGCSEAFRPYSADDDEGLPPSPAVPVPDGDPFALPK